MRLPQKIREVSVSMATKKQPAFTHRVNQGHCHLYWNNLTITCYVKSLVKVDLFLYGLSFFVGQNAITIANPKRRVVGPTLFRILERTWKGKALVQMPNKQEQTVIT